MTIVDEVKALLTDGYGLTVTAEKPIQNGTQVLTAEGPMVSVYTTGKCVPGGKKVHLIADFKERLAGGPLSKTPAVGRKVFVVYGHDEDARTQLEAMLRRWDLHPILLDQLTSEGDTLIEKLEGSMDEAAFAVVLATPDDEGHPKDKSTEKKFRVRQNVVLELGMMLRGLGRRKVAILLQQRLLDVLANGDLPTDKIRTRLNRITQKRASIDERLHDVDQDLQTSVGAIKDVVAVCRGIGQMYVRAEDSVRTLVNQAMFEVLFLDQLADDTEPETTTVADFQATPLVNEVLAMQQAWEAVASPGTAHEGRTAEAGRTALESAVTPEQTLTSCTPNLPENTKKHRKRASALEVDEDLKFLAYLWTGGEPVQGLNKASLVELRV